MHALLSLVELCNHAVINSFSFAAGRPELDDQAYGKRREWVRIRAKSYARSLAGPLILLD
jgi:hypothetical protein